MLALALHSLVLDPARLESARLVPTQTGVSASHARAARVAKISQRCSSRPSLRAWSHAHRKRARCPSARAWRYRSGKQDRGLFASAPDAAVWATSSSEVDPDVRSCRCLATEACTGNSQAEQDQSAQPCTERFLPMVGRAPQGKREVIPRSGNAASAGAKNGNNTCCENRRHLAPCQYSFQAGRALFVGYE